MTSACSKIGPGIAQHIDQLERHSVALAERQHLVLAQAREVSNMPETKERPKFTDTTGNQIGVFVQIGGGAERANLLRIVEALQIEHLATRDFLQHDADVSAIRLLDSLQAYKAIGRRFKELPLAVVFL